MTTASTVADQRRARRLRLGRSASDPPLRRPPPCRPPSAFSWPRAVRDIVSSTAGTFPRTLLCAIPALPTLHPAHGSAMPPLSDAREALWVTCLAHTTSSAVDCAPVHHSSPDLDAPHHSAAGYEFAVRRPRAP